MNLKLTQIYEKGVKCAGGGQRDDAGGMQCKCEKVDAPDDVSELNMVFVLDGAISCDNITEMAFEEHVSVEGGTTLRRVDVHKVKCRDYGD